jgi:AraC-like DNA-binding protein
MTKVLYVNGDSFAFGEELGAMLPGCYSQRYNEYSPPQSEYQRRNCFGGIIAHEMNSEHVNAAIRGASNERTLRVTVLDVLGLLNDHRPEDIFVIICLTVSSRREYYDSYLKRYFKYTASSIPDEETEKKIWQVMSRYSNSEHVDNNDNCATIISLISFLSCMKVPYLMFQGHSYFQYHYNNDVNKLLKNINRLILSYSFNNMCEERMFSRGPGLHPLEDAHKFWADHLLEYIHANDLLSNRDL